MSRTTTAIAGTARVERTRGPFSVATASGTAPATTRRRGRTSAELISGSFIASSVCADYRSSERKRVTAQGTSRDKCGGREGEGSPALRTRDLPRCERSAYAAQSAACHPELQIG